MRALGCMHSPQAAQVQVLGYSTKVQTWLGLRFVPIPGLSTSGDQVFGKRCHPQLKAVTYASPVPAARFSECTKGVPSQVCCVSLLGS